MSHKIPILLVSLLMALANTSPLGSSQIRAMQSSSSSSSSAFSSNSLSSFNSSSFTSGSTSSISAGSLGTNRIRHHANNFSNLSSSFSPKPPPIPLTKQLTPEEINALGVRYLHGRTQEDFQKAFACFKTAAMSGCNIALCNLGICYDQGKGTKQNTKKAFECYEKSIKKIPAQTVFKHKIRPLGQQNQNQLATQENNNSQPTTKSLDLAEASESSAFIAAPTKEELEAFFKNTPSTWRATKRQYEIIKALYQKTSLPSEITWLIACYDADFQGNLLATFHLQDKIRATLPNGILISGETNLKFWNSKTGQHLKTIECDNCSILALVVLSQKELALSLTSEHHDYSIIILNINFECNPKRLSGHSAKVNTLAILSSGQLASSSYDKTIRIWNIQTRICLQIINLIDKDYGSFINRSLIKFYTFTTPETRYSSLDKGEHYTNDNYVATCMTTLPNDHLAIADKFGTIKIFKIGSNAKPHMLFINYYADHYDEDFVCNQHFISDLTRSPGNVLTSIGTTPTGSSRRKYETLLWDLTDFDFINHRDLPPATASARLPDERLVLGHEDGSITIWRNYEKAELTLHGHQAKIIALLVLPDGSLLSQDANKTVKIRA